MSSSLDDIGFSTVHAAAMSHTGAKALQNRFTLYGLISKDELTGVGRSAHHNLSAVFSYALAQTLTQVGLSAADACSLARHANALGIFLEDERGRLNFYRQDGTWVAIPRLDADGAEAAVVLVVNPARIWTGMIRPIALQLFPAETEAFDAKLAALRQRQAAGDPNPNADAFNAVAEETYSRRGQAGE